MTSMELLLEYLSACERGTWETFRRAALEVARLAGEDDVPRWTTSVIADNLAALGHAEFAFESTLEWEIMPVCLVASPGLGPGHGILTGARCSDTLETIEQVARDTQLRITRESQRLAPPVIELEAAEDEDLAMAAARAGLVFEWDGPRRLVRCLPDIASMYTAAPEASHPLGFPSYRFDGSKLDWVVVKSVEQDGSYRFDSYRPEYRIMQGGSMKKVSRSVAIYHALKLAGRSLTVYLASTREFLVPARAPMPVLYTRALTLFSGRVPAFDPGAAALRFQAIPVEAATIVQQRLGEIGRLHE